MDSGHKISYKNKPTPPNYQKILNSISGKFDDIFFRWSFNGVPHLLLEHDRMVYSLCYFKGRKSWRLFYPYRKEQKKKVDFKTWEQAIEWTLAL